jgi:ERCC4-type nuclease
MIVDTREPPRFRHLPGAIVKEMIIADFVIGEIGIERKTLSDFIQSVKGGKMFNQINDLCANFDRSMLLMEVDAGRLTTTDRVILLGALARIAADYKELDIICLPIQIPADKFLLKLEEKVGASSDEHHYSFRRVVGNPAVYSLAAFKSISPTLAKRLLERFGSVFNVANASLDELKEVEGIGEGRALALYNGFRAVDNTWDIVKSVEG